MTEQEFELLKTKLDTILAYCEELSLRMKIIELANMDNLDKIKVRKQKKALNDALDSIVKEQF